MGREASCATCPRGGRSGSGCGGAGTSAQHVSGTADASGDWMSDGSSGMGSSVLRAGNRELAALRGGGRVPRGRGWGGGGKGRGSGGGGWGGGRGGGGGGGGGGRVSRGGGGGGRESARGASAAGGGGDAQPRFGGGFGSRDSGSAARFRARAWSIARGRGGGGGYTSSVNRWPGVGCSGVGTWG